jgi:hypothetical protein
MLGGDGGFATARWREPASSDRLPSHRSESPTGYSSAGCSPAEPASRLIPLSQVDQYLGLAGQIQNVAGFEFFGS